MEAVGTPIGHQVACTPRQWVDSEDEAGEPEADWSSHVSADILQTLSDTEKRRQEIINGNYLHERTRTSNTKNNNKIDSNFPFHRNLSNGTKSCANTSFA